MDAESYLCEGRQLAGRHHDGMPSCSKMHGYRSNRSAPELCNTENPRVSLTVELRKIHDRVKELQFRQHDMSNHADCLSVRRKPLGKQPARRPGTYLTNATRRR